MLLPLNLDGLIAAGDYIDQINEDAQIAAEMSADAFAKRKFADNFRPLKAILQIAEVASQGTLKADELAKMVTIRDVEALNAFFTALMAESGFGSAETGEAMAAASTQPSTRNAEPIDAH